MAQGATIYKVQLQVNDMDRQVFDTVTLALARHPSETEERLMVRLLAYGLHLGEGLTFGRGISSEDEATLWQHDLTGSLQHWVEAGLPDERLLRRASGRADVVTVYAYGGRTAGLWWLQNSAALAALGNLTVFDLPPAFTQALAAMAQRNMQVQLTVQEGELWVAVGEETLHLALEVKQQRRDA